MTPDQPANEDHPQTIEAGDDQSGPERTDASPLPAEAELGDELAQTVRRDATGAITMGDAIGSTSEGGIGSGTPPDPEQLGGGDPPIATGDADPIGTYSPGGRGD